MKIAFEYSHLGGAEILQKRYPEVDRDIADAIAAIGDDFRTFQSSEKTKRGRMLFSPTEMNAAFKREFRERGFEELRRPFSIDVPGWTRLRAQGSKQIDFARGRVLVEVQLGKYFAMFYDMAKLEYFYRHDLADVGVEIVPSYMLQAEMSSGVGRGEMLIVDIIALQRSFPTFPVKVILIQPSDMPLPKSIELGGDDIDPEDNS